jgi:Fe-S-cluster containining protein
VVREVITAETCRSCGACCAVPLDQEMFCDVTPEDEERLGEHFVRRHVLRLPIFDQLLASLDGRSLAPGAIATRWRTQRSGLFKGWEINTCVALRGSVLSRVSCSVYDQRPRACREAVKPGDRMCRTIRRELKEKLDAQEIQPEE